MYELKYLVSEICRILEVITRVRSFDQYKQLRTTLVDKHIHIMIERQKETKKDRDR